MTAAELLTLSSLIAEAEAPQRQLLARLAAKYRARGMRADRNYRLDLATRTLLVIEPEAPQ